MLTQNALSAISVSVIQLAGNIVVDGSTFFVITILGTFGNPLLLTILGSRMFFNLKEAAEHGVNEGTNWGSHAASSIRFENGPGGQQYVAVIFVWIVGKIQNNFRSQPTHTASGMTSRGFAQGSQIDEGAPTVTGSAGRGSNEV